MKKLLLILFLIASLLQPASAYRPSNWTWFAYPYSYDTSSGHWTYYSASGSTWVYNCTSGSWYLLGSSLLKNGWSYWQWPYAYCQANGAWYYINTETAHWVSDSSTSQWSLFGQQGSSVSSAEERIHTLINGYRQSNGRSALSYSSTIASIARLHSQRMANGTVPFGHDGFDARFSEIGTYMTVVRMSENVSWNSGYADPPYQAYVGWVNSPGHYANLMDSQVNITGVGAAQAASGAWYFTQIFVGTY